MKFKKILFLSLFFATPYLFNCSDSKPKPQPNYGTTPVPVETITLNYTSIDLQIGESKQLVATITPANATKKNLVWNHYQDNRVLVSQDGVITGITAGYALVWATLEDGSHRTECRVTVHSSWNVTAEWAATLTKGLGNTYFYQATTDQNDNVFAVGSVDPASNYDFGNNVTLPQSNCSGALILMKYNSEGIAQWVKSALANYYAHYYSVAVDSTGNIYAGGSFCWHLLDLGNNVTIVGNSSNSGLLVKYDQSGTTLWARTLDPNAFSCGSQFNSIKSDGQNTVYAAGYIYGKTTFLLGNGVTLVGSSNSKHPVLIKYDTNGNVIWAKNSLTDNTSSEFRSITVDSSGNIYAAGVLTGTGIYDFGNGVTVNGVHTNDDSSILLVKYDPNGTALWAKSATAGSNFSWFSGVAVDPNGNVIAAGSMLGSGSIDLGNGIICTGAYPGYNTLLVKYDPSGNPLWAKSAIDIVCGYGNGAFIGAKVADVAVDSQGNIFATGSMIGTTIYYFSSDVAISGACFDGPNAFLIKYNADGIALWALSTVQGDTGSEYSSVSVNFKNEIITAGAIIDSATFSFGNGVTIRGTNYLGTTPTNIVTIKYTDRE